MYSKDVYFCVEQPNLQYANVTMRAPVWRARRLIGVVVQREP